MSQTETQKTQISFEEALENLDQITSALEQGNLNLEDAIKAFNEGKKWLLYCEELLGKAQEALTLVDLENRTGIVLAEEMER